MLPFGMLHDKIYSKKYFGYYGNYSGPENRRRSAIFEWVPVLNEFYS